MLQRIDLSSGLLGNAVNEAIHDVIEDPIRAPVDAWTRAKWLDVCLYGAPTIRAIRPDGRGEVTGTHIAWESRASVPLMPSFAYAGGLLFCVKESGVVLCLEAGTGQVMCLWRG